MYLDGWLPQNLSRFRWLKFSLLLNLNKKYPVIMDLYITVIYNITHKQHMTVRTPNNNE